VKKPEMMDDDVFHRFVHACLIRIPSVEDTAEKALQGVLFALQSNEDLRRLDGLEQIRNDVGILVHDLQQIRRELRLSRHNGRANGIYFPPDIQCKTIFRRTRIVKEDALPGCALTNSFPSSRDGYLSSWDLKGTTVTNLMIPSEGINSLMEDLKKGKFFGFKASFIYSGRLMILWDGAAFIFNGFLLAICELLKDSNTVSAVIKGGCGFINPILEWVAVIFIGKIIFHDLPKWAPSYRKFAAYIRKSFSRDRVT
jgi:hypothetical protein